jgi:hypothetical protein
VVLLAVNDTLADVRRTIDLSEFATGGQEIAVWTLVDRDRAGEPDATNGFGDPERICARRSRFAAPAARFEYQFPALSLSVLTWRVEDARR